MYGTVHRSDWDVYRLLATSTDPWSIVCQLQPKLAPCSVHHQWTWDQWALDTGLSPGAPVNNCRWASTPLVKLQASSIKRLTAGHGYDRMDLERNKTYD
jgi:hypothetical protein